MKITTKTITIDGKEMIAKVGPTRHAKGLEKACIGGRYGGSKTGKGSGGSRGREVKTARVGM